MSTAASSLADYYSQAFSRNIGLVTPAEQERLRHVCVAIPGMGGMGGVAAATLARTGIGRFRIADADVFEVVNMNRQYGATVHTLRQNKAEVMAEIIRTINPEADVTVFTEPIGKHNVDEFLAGADVVQDALDYFALEARRLICSRARDRGLYVVSAGPLGFSGVLLVFSPTGMSFEEYYDLRDGLSLEEQLIAFAVGTAPAGIHLRYMDPKSVDFQRGYGPSLGVACQIASGMAAAEIVKILLGRGPVRPVPYFSQFDAYTMQYQRGRLWWGNRHPLQRLKRWYVKRFLLKGARLRSRPAPQGGS
ncbi:MAG: ThiF family adenylyltransferase [Armatimonadota bacterium]|nr:ThiF family adenylyltransferase [Armatimonadota bacterium]MDR7447839.1 ThiF family adenylyltransferase [Armatimonadota bacterium]MDR7479812.1 ThiF family adenylyltransferase [Armatimonadota bacterium]MDR7487525.1 ThiF family adenylyltransferase [Armatimonadota bacterium]MDR7501817.1 ThiF family adenylyltransferase [Armatimonadota bacterium]